MTDNVIPLRQPEPTIWVCNCGCATFKVYSDQSIVCAQCAARGPDGEWVIEPPPVAPRAPKHVERVVTDLKKSWRLVLNDALRDYVNDPLAFILLMAESGAFVTWADECDTPERIAWLDRQFARARAMIVREPKE